jgi:Protein of unknown function (DUF3152)
VSLFRRPIAHVAVAAACLALTPVNGAAARGFAHLHLVHGHSAVVGHGPLKRFRVEVQSSLHKKQKEFTAMVLATLGDRRDWGHDYRFKRVSSGRYTFTVVLATPEETNRLCEPLNTASIYSCYNGGRSIINDYRWSKGAASYHWKKRLTAYRRYVISHEIGHALGHAHVYHCRADGLAPTMMQQTKSLYGCKRNPWPYPHAHR